MDNRIKLSLAPGAVVKADYQFFDNAVAGNNTKGQLNIGLVFGSSNSLIG